MSDWDDDPEAFSKEIPLTAVFGTHPKTKIISAMLTEDPDPPTHFSVNEVARISGLDPATVEEHISDLHEFGLVVETDELDTDATYLLDRESTVVSDIKQLYADLFDHSATSE